jgi:hypothetical protein
MITVLLMALCLTQSPTVKPGKPQEFVAQQDPSDAPGHLVVRAHRKNILAMELGWNSLTGVGALYSRNVHPNVSLDAGLGFSSRGGQFGVRARYNILTDALTPFVGLGFTYGSGFSAVQEAKNSDDVVRFGYVVRPTPLAQATVGLSWQTLQGFSLMGMLGYAQLLQQINTHVVLGTTNYADRFFLSRIFGSGPVAAINVGYAF